MTDTQPTVLPMVTSHSRHLGQKEVFICLNCSISLKYQYKPTFFHIVWMISPNKIMSIDYENVTMS